MPTKAAATDPPLVRSVTVVRATRFEQFVSAPTDLQHQPVDPREDGQTPIA